MIPINELQAKIYQCLSDLDIKVYDEKGNSIPLFNAYKTSELGNKAGKTYGLNGIFFKRSDGKK